MLRVKFLTKKVDPTDYDYHLLTERSADFADFKKAMDFVRSLKFNQKDRLVCNPEIVELAG